MCVHGSQPVYFFVKLYVIMNVEVCVYFLHRLCFKQRRADTLERAARNRRHTFGAENLESAPINDLIVHGGRGHELAFMAR